MYSLPGTAQSVGKKKRKKPASKDAGAKQYISVTLREVHGMFWGHKNDFCVHQGGDKDGF